MSADSSHRSDIRQRLGLRPIINVSGTMTGLGASIVVPEAVRAVADILPEFVRRGVTPDILTDQTSAHDELNGYVPNGMPYEEALKLLAAEGTKLIELNRTEIFTSVRLRPRIVLRARDEERDSVTRKARRALEAAQKYSLVANSVKSEIIIEPKIEVVP